MIAPKNALVSALATIVNNRWMPVISARLERQNKIRSLFDQYIKMDAARDDRLTTRFSDNFSGYTGGGDFLVTDRAEWVRITRQDFA